MNASTKKQLLKAKKLISEGDYESAQILLWDVNHPIAEKWLTIIDKKLAEKKKTSSSANQTRWLMLAIPITIVATAVMVVLVFHMLNYQIINQPYPVDLTEQHSVESAGTATPTLDYIPWIYQPTATIRQEKDILRDCKKEVQGIFSDVYDSRLESCILWKYTYSDFKERE